VAKQVAVSYAVNMTGNLAQQANQGAAAVQNLGNSANKAMPHLGGLTMQQSNMVSQAETVISMFGQMGGSISQVSILASSGIRPFAMLSAQIGLATAAAAGLGAVAGIVAVAALFKLTGTALDLAAAAGEAGDELRELGYLTAEQSSFANQMEQSTAALAVTQDLLTVRLASSAEVVGTLHHAYVGLWASLADGVTTIGNVYAGLVDLHREVVRGTPVVGEYAAEWLDLIGPGGGNVGMNPLLNAALKALADRGKEAADELERANRAKDELLIYGPEAPAGMLPGAIYGPDLPAGMSIYGRSPRPTKAGAAEPGYEALVGSIGQVSGRGFLPETMTGFDGLLASLRATVEVLESRVNPALDEMASATEAQLAATARAQGGVGALGAALSGDMNQVVGFGLEQAGLAGDPVMMATSMILQALPNLQETLGGLFEQVFDTYTNLDDIIGGIASELVPEMIRALPEMMASFVTLAPAIVAELIVAAPLIFEAVIDAIVELPSAIANAIVDVLDPFGVVHTTGKGERNPTGSKVGAVIGGILGTPFGPPGVVAGAVIGAQVGGGLEGGGRGRVELSSRTSRGGPVVIHNHIAGDVRQSSANLRRAQGTYGWNETLEGPV
jgi:hypothetical protein